MRTPPFSRNLAKDWEITEWAWVGGCRLDAVESPRAHQPGGGTPDAALFWLPLIIGAEWEESGTQEHSWGWEVPGVLLSCGGIPFLSRVPSPCLSHLGACLKCLVKGLLPWFSDGVILLPPLPRGTLATSGTFWVVTAGVVLLAGCC